MTRPAWLAHFGSLRATLATMGLVAAVLVARIVTDELWGWALAIGFVAMAANLVVALVVHPALRQRLPLLIAHLAMLALVVLAGIGRMTSLDGRFELTQGLAFDGTLLDGRRGAWYRDRLGALAFTHEHFDIEYAPGRKRGATRNRVAWHDADGTPRRAVIGDHRPLIIEGHRIYTSPNKGFAPLLRWQPSQGQPVLGSVHLPSFPVHELRQSQAWTLPDGREAWVMLRIDDTLIDPARATRFEMPREHRLIVRVDDVRAELTPGGSIALPGGTLVYEGLRTWMGYRVSHDPTLPWLLAASLLAALAMAWHYAAAFMRRSRTTTNPAATTNVARGIA